MSEQIRLVKATNYDELTLKVGQEREISNPRKIQNALLHEDCLGYEAYIGVDKIGFALIREFVPRQYFLWNFIIDAKYQGQGIGKLFLKSLINKLTSEFHAEVITTTYNFGNERAKRLYEHCGFRETDIVLDDDIHEVNMILEFQKANGG